VTGPAPDAAPARVVGTHGRHVVVETPAGERWRCHLRGKRNEAVVGDLVRWQRAGDEGVVEAIEPRRNLMYRSDEWRTKSFAANVDGVLLMVAGSPPCSESQLARAAIAASAAGVDATILLNKIDLPETALARERLAAYRALGMPVLEVALKPAPAAAVESLWPHLRGRVTLVLGPSGVGKSTLVNRLVPTAAAQVGELSRALRSGRHTTTTTTWYWLDAERHSALIDTPGFQEFGLRQIDAVRLASLMPDLQPWLGQCRFDDCTHREEPGCAVRAAVDRGEIAASRYRIYRELYDELAPSRR
jgi:ribosome biogenesis GTPase